MTRNEAVVAVAACRECYRLKHDEMSAESMHDVAVLVVDTAHSQGMLYEGIVGNPGLAVRTVQKVWLEPDAARQEAPPHPRRIYVASSWRNEYQPLVVVLLRTAGHEVYDFRHPGPGEHGFAWSEISPDWQRWTSQEYIDALQHPIAQLGYGRDRKAMDWADTCVLVLPCGRSAHLEAGFMAGAGKRVFVLQLGALEPELMALLCTAVVASPADLLAALWETP